MEDGQEPSGELSTADLPSAAEGWSLRALEFALAFDGDAHVGGDPDRLAAMIAEALESLERAGRLPPALKLDDFRAILFGLARYEHVGGEVAREPRHLHLYWACLDAIRQALIAGVTRKTRAGSRHRCPVCGSRDVARIMYGLPARDPFFDPHYVPGEIAYGGCCVSDESPEYSCSTCGHEWGRVWPRWSGASASSP